MDIYRLDHANLRTAQLETMVAWYRDILGFERGWRPAFSIPGAWMYRHGQPMVHLVDVAEPGVSEADLALEHIAFASRGLDAFRAHLVAHDVRFDEVKIEIAGIVQVNIWDPDGNHLHIDFPVEEAA